MPRLLHPEGPRAPGRIRRTTIACALVIGASMLTGGCATPLFPRDQPRSQFESYDAVRNQSEPRYTYDEFGRATPNLRGRLSPN
jgi:hypothetical protein